MSETRFSIGRCRHGMEFLFFDVGHSGLRVTSAKPCCKRFDTVKEFPVTERDMRELVNAMEEAIEAIEVGR